MAIGLGLLYLFLYAPIFYVIYTSFAVDIVWPFPPAFTVSGYQDLFSSSLYGAALVNGFVFIVFAVMYLLMRSGTVKFGYRGQ